MFLIGLLSLKKMKILSEKIMSTEQVENETDYVVCKVDSRENKRYYNSEGQYHREDGPAVEFANGDKFWHINNKLHRDDGPALELINGGKSWWINGKFHREDGPAIERTDGDKIWYLNGKEVDEETVRKIGKMK